MQLGEPRQTGSPQAGSLRRHSRAIVLRIVAAQIAVGLLIALALFVLQGQFQGYSALVGALIAALPNYYLVVRMFQRRGSDSAEDLLRNVYVAEMVKIVFTVSLFAMAIIMLNIDFRVAVLVYAATVAVNWIGFKFSNLGEGSVASKPNTTGV